MSDGPIDDVELVARMLRTAQAEVDRLYLARRGAMIRALEAGASEREIAEAAGVSPAMAHKIVTAVPRLSRSA